MSKKSSSKTQEKISREIEKLMSEWKETKKMTTSRATYRPKTQEEAMRQAAAIAYGKHKVGRSGSKRKKKK
ncbi:MAG: hypothetical protein KatS3mg096_753 [Candidatus Parcubacteria bacterium]|nr:MAG: hypothetical protein KatS3mg096_753 [Candidatus Parcubacteria bacterium]